MDQSTIYDRSRGTRVIIQNGDCREESPVSTAEFGVWRPQKRVYRAKKFNGFKPHMGLEYFRDQLWDYLKRVKLWPTRYHFYLNPYTA